MRLGFRAVFSAGLVMSACTNAGGSDSGGLCTIEEIRQYLVEANEVYSLTITYRIQDSASIIGNEFRVGPLPTTALAGCPAVVELRQPGMIGKNEAGDQIWRISTLPTPNIAETDQTMSLRVEVAPL